jgi:hypothetical protein
MNLLLRSPGWIMEATFSSEMMMTACNNAKRDNLNTTLQILPVIKTSSLKFQTSVSFSELQFQLIVISLV